jgi:glucokinase
MRREMSKRDQSPLRLLADIGGTYARFAVQRAGHPAEKLRRYRCADFADIVTAIRSYFRQARLRSLPTVGAIAVAAPVVGDKVSMTNHPWRFSIEAVRGALGFDALVVVNDFLAIAESIPFLKASDRRKIGGNRGMSRAPIAVVGPGTGLGVGALVPDEDVGDKGMLWHAIATEGGHATMAGTNEREDAVIRQIRTRHSHVSAERCLSGRGLVNIHRALAEIEQLKARELAPPAITRRAQKGDQLAREAVAMFCAMLGSTAGNLALIYGAVGGVYIAGGIVPKLGRLFDTRLFRDRFADKGRYRRYLAPIPTYVITHPLPALVGLAALLDRRARATLAIMAAGSA